MMRKLFKKKPLCQLSKQTLIRKLRYHRQVLAEFEARHSADDNKLRELAAFYQAACTEISHGQELFYSTRLIGYYRSHMLRAGFCSGKMGYISIGELIADACDRLGKRKEHHDESNFKS